MDVRGHGGQRRKRVRSWSVAPCGIAHEPWEYRGGEVLRNAVLFCLPSLLSSFSTATHLASHKNIFISFCFHYVWQKLPKNRGNDYQYVHFFLKSTFWPSVTSFQSGTLQKVEGERGGMVGWPDVPYQTGQKTLVLSHLQGYPRSP